MDGVERENRKVCIADIMGKYFPFIIPDTRQTKTLHHEHRFVEGKKRSNPINLR